MFLFRIEQPAFGLLHSMGVDEVKNVLLKVLVHHLRRMLHRYWKLRRQLLEREISIGVEFFRLHRVSQSLKILLSPIWSERRFFVLLRSLRFFVAGECFRVSQSEISQNVNENS